MKPAIVGYVHSLTVALLTELQMEFLVNLLGNYHRTIVKELSKPFKSRKDKAILKEKLVICQEIADCLNVLESEEVPFFDH